MVQEKVLLKILSGEIEANTGELVLLRVRISVLKQDHYQFDDFPVIETVIMGNPRLYEIKKEKDELYSRLTLQMKMVSRLLN